MTDLTLAITGMSCAGCVSRLEKMVSAVDGVTKISVNLAAETAHISFDSDNVSVKKIYDKIIDLGFGVKSEQVVFSVKGMHCGSCVKRVEDIIKSISGVLNASVNLPAETAGVEFITGAASADNITKSINSIGFDASLPDTGPDTKGKKKQLMNG